MRGYAPETLQKAAELLVDQSGDLVSGTRSSLYRRFRLAPQVLVGGIGTGDDTRAFLRVGAAGSWLAASSLKPTPGRGAVHQLWLGSSLGLSLEDQGGVSYRAGVSVGYTLQRAYTLSHGEWVPRGAPAHLALDSNVLLGDRRGLEWLLRYQALEEFGVFVGIGRYWRPGSRWQSILGVELTRHSPKFAAALPIGGLLFYGIAIALSKIQPSPP